MMFIYVRADTSDVTEGAFRRARLHIGLGDKKLTAAETG
jgi:hypothetical protein